jgi:hypothetical protein
MSCSASLPIPLPRPVIAAGDCFGALHRFPPRQPLVAADERLAVRALCRDVYHHLPDAVRTVGEGRHDPVAKLCF